MRTASVFIATSLDGFIARKDGSLDWLDKANEVAPAGEDCGYKSFMGSVDALVMGRNTFEKVLSFNCPWPYSEKHVVVLSSKEIAIPDGLKNLVSQASGPPTEIVEKLASKGLNRLYIDGGVTIQKFLAAGLVDRITVTLVPVLIGEGISLFGSLPKERYHQKVCKFGKGGITLNYYVLGRYRYVEKDHGRRICVNSLLG